MSNILEHIKKGEWYHLFPSNEQDDLLTFYYNLMRWIERDEADELVLTSKQFSWKKQGEIVGMFPITTSEPTPSFRAILLSIRERDSVIKEFIVPDKNDETLFYVVRS